jgi:hypothetical protein
VPVNRLTAPPARQQHCSTADSMANSPCHLRNDKMPSKENPSARVTRLRPAEKRLHFLDIGSFPQIEKLFTSSRAISLTNRTMGTWIVHWTEMILLRQRGGDHPETEVQPEEPALTATSFSRTDRSPGLRERVWQRLEPRNEKD